MRVVAIVVLAALVTPAAAEAETTSYRGVLIAGDAVALAFTAGGSALVYRSRDCECEDFSGELVVFGLGAYAVIGAVVHHDAGHGDRAFASVALRAALPIAAGSIAHASGASTDRSLLVAGAGMLAAMAIDWFALAEPRTPRKPTVTFYAAPARDGVVAGVSGALP